MPYAIRLNIMVGIGGTGRDAVLKVKRKLQQVYGEVPPTVKFLVLDTTAPTNIQYEEKTVELAEGTEFVTIQMSDPLKMMRKADIKSWCPERIPVRAATDGAGQVRAVGRMALFANDDKVFRRIDEVVKSIRDFKIGRLQNDKYELISNKVIVNVVCSLGGGTGGGTFLDVGYLFRRAGAVKPDFKICGYFLLPSIFKGLPFTQNVEPNCYGAITELDYLMSHGSDGDELSYQFGDKIRLSREFPPFDLVYLVDNVNKVGTTYSELGDLTEFLSTGLFVSCGAVARNANDSIDNAETQILGMKSVGGKKSQYCCFGISEVLYNRQQIADHIKNNIALKIVSAINMESKLDPQKEVETFIDFANIREDGSYDKVVDAILPPANLKRLEIPELKKGAAQKILDYKSTYLNRIEEEAIVLANKNYESLLRDKLAILRGELAKRIDSREGLYHTQKFVSILMGRLNAFKEMMVRERTEIDQQCKRTQSKHEVLLEDIKKAETKILGQAKAIQEACINYQRNALAEASQAREMKRRERAAEVFENVQAELKLWQQRLSDIETHLSKITEDLSSDIQKSANKKKEIEPFVIELDSYVIPKIEIGDVDLNDFLHWLKEHKRSMVEWADERTADVRKMILEYCGEQTIVKQVLDSDIEQEMMKLPEGTRLKIVKELDDMAVPLWQYSAADVRGTNPEMLYTFGVPDQEKTFLRDDTVLGQLKGSVNKPTHVSTNDPNRIIFFKSEVAIPAFAISRIQRFKEAYLEDNAPFNFHSDRLFETLMLDVYPEDVGDTQGRVYWSVALAPPDLGFGFIRREATYFRMRSEATGKAVDDYMVMLEQGRTAAMKKFLSKPEWISELKKAVEDRVRQLGNAAVIANLKTYRERLLTEARKAGDEMRKQLELELRDVDTFVKMLE